MLMQCDSKPAAISLLIAIPFNQTASLQFTAQILRSDWSFVNMNYFNFVIVGKLAWYTLLENNTLLNKNNSTSL